jgi:hypothetical protein
MGAEPRLGLAAAAGVGEASAFAVPTVEEELVEGGLEFFASLFSAMAGANAMAKTRREDRDFFSVNIDVISSSGSFT